MGHPIIFKAISGLTTFGIPSLSHGFKHKQFLSQELKIFVEYC